MKRRMARVLAMVMAVVLMGTSTNVTAFAVGICDHHLEHTAGCGYVEAVEGADCTHAHDDECYSEVVKCVHEHDENCGYAVGVEDSCTHTCSVESRCITTKENCNHSHDENCGYVQAQEGTPCSFVCNVCEAEASDEDDEDAVCICEEKCTADIVNEECPVCAAENADLNNCIGEATEEKIITAWSFIDEYECIDLETNTLALPGASAENVALKSDVISLLPTSIVATVNETEENITLSGWECEDYPETGAYAGTYTFTATLPVGYTLGEEVSELTVNVELGGAGLYDEEQTTGDFTVTGGTYGQDYTYDNEAGLLTIQSSEKITIANADPSTSTTDRIEVADGVSANITLDGVNIDVSATENTAAFKIADNSTGNVTITLADGTTNTLKSGGDCAGLQKNGAYISETQGKLTITGTGSLTATGGDYGAGIGGGDGCDGSYITISGGEVTATGGDSAAGIGGGWNGNGSNIEISGGEVTATGGEYGAGIGGGFEGNGSNIEISGGKVTATGGDDGAGIGSGDSGSGSYITISGGEVTATGGEEAAGIGGGWNGNGSNIEISGGEVTATGGEKAAGIGGGFKGNGSNIEISGGSVKAVAGEKYEYDGTTYFPAAIGQGVQYDGNTGVYSNGAEVTPTYGADNVYLTDNVYLLELDVDGTSDVTINGKAYPTKHFDENKVYVYLPAGEHTIVKDGGAGTTAYYAKNADNKLEAVAIVTAFTITGTDLVYGTDYTYTGGVLTILSDKAMTIENVNPSTSTTDRIEVADGVSANITLAGVNIDVSSQSNTAAFKIADNSAGNVTITLADGTTNTLKSGRYCAGLQKNGEYSETLGKLTITGTGSLTATGGEYGAGIGGGLSSGSNITISGGVVIANGGGGAYGGAGIGGGDGCDGSYIEISGGTVTATGGEYGAGIGGGRCGSYITISGGKVTAAGGGYGAGIGGGRDGRTGSGSNITINGGTVTATGGEYGAGIGGGHLGSGSNIKISGGTVTATGGEKGAGIGGGYAGSADNITISGGVVIANGGSGAYDIGSSSTDNITISGGSVKADTIGCTPTDGTANATPVYLLKLVVDGTSAVTINGKAYPTKHIDTNKLYVYLPAGNYTVANGNSQKIYAIADEGAVSEVDVGTAFTITGTTLVYGTDYTYPADTGVLTILSDKDITIKNTNPSTPTTNRIEVADGVSANITLAGVNIDVSSQSHTAAFKIADNSAGNVTITLADGTTNTLKSGTYCAGLQKNGEYSETLGKLTITGTGTLTATGGDYGAGIGGGSSGSGSNIEISGGTVTATCGEGGAGIGGGWSGSGSDIKISGGTVTATGGEYGAGIGGGKSGSGSNIEISGGTVEAQGGDSGAGIGGGYYGSGSYITISGGTVKAQGGKCGAGIGGGDSYGQAVGCNIKISGGTVTATGGEKGAGIGGGISGSGSNIEISGGTVTATGGESGAGIGGGYNRSADNIKISGGEVTATGGKGGAGIGGGYPRGSADNITISGGSVKAVAGEKYKYDGTTYFPAAIGQSVQYNESTSVYSDGAEVTPTDGNGNNVYLLELTSATSSLKIDGKDYPINHGTDGKVYVYLPEGEHTIVKDGGAGTTARYAKNADNKLEAVATGGGSDDDSGDDETGGSSGNSSGGSSGGSSDDSSAGITEGGITSDKPVTQTPISQAPAENIVAPATPQPGGKTPVAEPDEETDNPEPFINGEDGKEGWNVIRDEVEDAEVGDTVTVDMNGTTVAPGDVLNDIKGKDITMVFDLGDGITWSVNGLSITSDNVGDIDFEVKVGADANDSIPVEVRNAVTGENNFVNISLAYDGEFGFEAVLSVNLEKENAGLYANLFYYNPQTNEMEFICSDVIAEDGTAELIFTHASEYTIVTDKVAMDAPASSEEGILPEIGVEAEEDNSSDATNVSDPLEFGSDDNNSAWWIILLIALLAVAGVAGFVVYSKKKKSE